MNYLRNLICMRPMQVLGVIVMGLIVAASAQGQESSPGQLERLPAV